MEEEAEGDDDDEDGQQPAEDSNNWARLRAELQARYIENYASNSRFIEKRADEDRRFHQAWINAASEQKQCPTCNQCSEDRVEEVPVLVITWESPLLVTVPKMFCHTPQCRGTKKFHICSLEVACFPGTPCQDWKLERPSGKLALWWSKSYLQQFDILNFQLRRLGAEALCSSLINNWQRNGCVLPPVSLYTLRTSLYKIMQEFQIVDDRVMHIPREFMSGLPSGSMNGCACCGVLVPATSSNRPDDPRPGPAPPGCEAGEHQPGGARILYSARAGCVLQ
jgi:hypothetical protein